MAENKPAKKTVELWEGYEVEVNENLLHDMDFLTDFNDAQSNNKMSEMISMMMAIVGGDKVYNDIREHITAEVGYFSVEGFSPIMEKIIAFFPKDGNRQSRRWEMKKNSR